LGTYLELENAGRKLRKIKPVHNTYKYEAPPNATSMFFPPTDNEQLSALTSIPVTNASTLNAKEYERIANTKKYYNYHNSGHCPFSCLAFKRHRLALFIGPN
jgi:hypothetical protein